MKPSSTEQLFDPLLKQLTALFRQRLDITVLTAGSIAARSASSLIFWALFGLICFFILLFLNIALAFALSSWSGGSPAVGFLYLSLIYALLLLTLLLLRPWMARQVRNGIARKTIRKAKQMNQRLDLIPYFRHQRYQSAVKSIHDAGTYVLLEQARYQTLLLEDETWPEFIQTLTYISNNRGAIVSGYLRDEAMAKVADIPLIGGIAQRMGYAPRSSRGSRRTSSASQTSWITRYSPALLLLWEVFRPSLTSFALGKAQSFIGGLFAGRRKPRR